MRAARARFLLRRFSIVALAVASIAGCGTMPVDETGPDGAPPPVQNGLSPDPLEGFNRAMYSFNDTLDRYFLRPVAKGYRYVTPSFVRQGASNFFSNLYEPINMVNNLLQGKVGSGLSDLGRFAVNSTIGIYGLFDIASLMGLEKHDEDFGQTLAVWGVGEGPYLVLPILGPRNFRDAFGEVPDYYLYPTTYMEDRRTAGWLTGARIIVTREQLLDATDILEQAAGDDPYVFVREAYRQRRRSQVYDGNPPAPPPDPSLFEDEPPPPETPEKTP